MGRSQAPALKTSSVTFKTRLVTFYFSDQQPDHLVAGLVRAHRETPVPGSQRNQDGAASTGDLRPSRDRGSSPGSWLGGRYPRDTWRLRNLGLDGPRATISFDQIDQPWLKELAKRWTRWRLSTGLGSQHASYGATTLARFSAFFTKVGAEYLLQLDRALLERYLADLHNELAGRASHSRHIGQLGAFFDAIPRHGWDTSLPANAVFHAQDYPKHGPRPPRALSEHVMSQLEDPANLDRWDNPALGLITLILMRCGLRISSVLTLAYDCITHDANGAPYLRYVNTKMKRQALVPIDETLVEQINHQQQRVQQQRPNGTPILFPRPKTNLRGDRIMDSQFYREGLSRWLRRCDVRDEHGRPVHVKPHQWRHTLGTRTDQLKSSR